MTVTYGPAELDAILLDEFPDDCQVACLGCSTKENLQCPTVFDDPIPKYSVIQRAVKASACLYQFAQAF